MSQRFSMSTASQAEHLREIADFVENAASACGLTENQICDVQMAVDEACTNIIEHGYHGKPDGAINIVCECRGGEFVVTIKDHGDRFDPDKVPPPKTRGPLSCRRVGGLGLYFMRKTMDKVTFHFSKRGNRLTMVKKIKTKI